MATRPTRSSCSTGAYRLLGFGSIAIMYTHTHKTSTESLWRFTVFFRELRDWHVCIIRSGLVPRSVRLAAHVASGFKSRREDLCKGRTSRRKRQPPTTAWTVKGPLQTLARNESERDSAARVGELAEGGEAPHRNPSRDGRWEGGKRDVRDRGRTRKLRRGPTSLPRTARTRSSRKGIPRSAGRPRSQSGP